MQDRKIQDAIQQFERIYEESPSDQDDPPEISAQEVIKWIRSQEDPDILLKANESCTQRISELLLQRPNWLGS